MGAGVNVSKSKILTALSPPAGVNISKAKILVALNPTGPVSITCNNPPNGTVGVPYAHTFPITGGTLPYVYSVTVPALPPGLSLNAATGVLSGIPTAAGAYTFSIQVTDSTPTSSTVSCGFTVNGALPVKITLRGVNRRHVLGCGDVKVGEVIQELPSVKRAV